MSMDNSTTSSIYTSYYYSSSGTCTVTATNMGRASALTSELSTFGELMMFKDARILFISHHIISHQITLYEIRVVTMQKHQAAYAATNMEEQDSAALNKHTSSINTEDCTISSTNSTSPSTSPSPHSKPCTVCHTPRDVLIRCQIDDTKKWHFVCTGRCWKDVSGGKVDGDGKHPAYRYGGMWKNKHEAVSAKIKGKAKDKNRRKDAGKSEGHLTIGEVENGV
ncbi:hypothetical protein BCIN_06g02480 [Botrytis cinerea B05.10]|uniref:Uncharacterized protein n=2 Tax=Botryotinia fuckeliana TaxID=40559 RepID=A0A384JJV8_BOTFB|nr:hypothetical protein BCIN_06g02480 [Botrytis cinerea B05.10]ATZ50762.1 hypothetical protein BCIN_06g02480 [Botrytis cinerea B05.10]